MNQNLATIHPSKHLRRAPHDEVRVKIGLRNNRLIHEREIRGLSQVQAAKKMGFSHWATLNGLETLRISPYRIIKKNKKATNAIWTNAVLMICEFYNRDAEYLFPESLDKLKRRNIEFTSEIDRIPAYFGGLISSPILNPEDEVQKKDQSKRIQDVLNRLSPREEAVLKMRYFDDMTLEEIGKKFGINRQRAHQLEQGALHKLRHPSVAKHIVHILKNEVPVGERRIGERQID